MIRLSGTRDIWGKLPDDINNDNMLELVYIYIINIKLNLKITTGYNI